MSIAQPIDEWRAQRDDLDKRGLWKEALTLHDEQLAKVSDEKSGEDLRVAVEAKRQLNQWTDFDVWMDGLLAERMDNAVLLLQAARCYAEVPPYGQLVAGEFRRGASGGGRMPMPMDGAETGIHSDAQERDRVRSLQLIKAAIGASKDDGLRAAAWLRLASHLSRGQAWKLQSLTDLETLPEYGARGPEGGTEGAPWDKDGPLLYQIPESWEAAKSDGERWRFALDQAAKIDPTNEVATILSRAEFATGQFGVQSLANQSWWSDPDPERSKGLLAVDTLAEDECLAMTSSGVRRFRLPADQHPIALYRSVLDRSEAAGDALADIYVNRNQRDKAAEILRLTITKHGDDKTRARKLHQITGNWARFAPSKSVPRGTKPVLPIEFRNASSIELSAAPVDMDKVLRDTIAYLKSNPEQLEWVKLMTQAIAERLIYANESKYIGKVSHQWTEKLDPLEKHRDKLTELTAPFSDSGAWWIRGKVEDGNEIYCLIWVVDSVLLQRNVNGAMQWWLADAETGAPIPDANVDFTGYRIDYNEVPNTKERRMDVRLHEFARRTDDEGKCLLKKGEWKDEFQYLAVARTAGRFPAFFGYSNMNFGWDDQEMGDPNRFYGISDRPLYQPGDTVHLKFYLRDVGYGEIDERRFANKSGRLVLRDGRGEEVLEIKDLKTDELGAVEASAVLPKNAAMGQWGAMFQTGEVTTEVSFRIEEFRKPEFEVAVEAPDEPVRLGDKFAVTVKANYFHGAPVRNSEVAVTVKRKTVREPWFPANRWDWLYGKGAWWCGTEASWHPGWNRWRCIVPPPPWFGGDHWTPDELVLKQQVRIGPDGTATLEVDTAMAKEIHGDMDARYEIEALVTDASRREERGVGSVIAARKPFELVVWTNRGHAKPGDAIEAQVSCATLAGKAVVGATGQLKVYQLSVADDGRIVETETQSWPVTSDADGTIRQAFSLKAAGQYRLAVELVFKGGERVEGATILNVHGSADDGLKWNFGPLELVPDKSSYAPGEALRLRVNSDQADAIVWLFSRAIRSNERHAMLIKLDGHSREVELPLVADDMPNFFIEAVTVFGAETHSAVRQVLLPPVSKTLDVQVVPATDKVKPGEKSSIGIVVRDAEGNPFQGKAVVTIYDKALEAITGGSNVSPIREAFWDWKRNYYGGRINNSVPQPSGSLHKPKQLTMDELGLRALGQEPFAGGLARGSAMGMRAKGNVMMEAAAPMAWVAADAGGGAAVQAPVIAERRDFADLLKWAGSVQTNAEGRAEIPLEFPDNLTTWKARVWTLGEGTRVGEGTAEIITSKELLVRMQMPRFLVERDRATLSAVVHNDHAAAKSVTVSLESDGDALELIDAAPQTIEIPAGGETRVDWQVLAKQHGEAKLRMFAKANDDGDAVEQTLPVLVHGMLRQDAWSRVLAPEQERGEIIIEIPEQRRPEASRLTVQVSPSVAGAVVDAIPYLADYPHGCTEQTLNRFVPAVIARSMLADMGIDLAAVKAKRNNLNPQELGDPAERAERWRQWKRNPVFDELELEAMVAAGVKRLAAMQNRDGGWGWFSGYGETSYAHTTAIVVHGLLTAKAHGADVSAAMLTQGINWLIAHERKQSAALQLFVEREALRKEGKKLKPDNQYEKHRSDAMDAFVRLVLGEAGRDSEPMLAFLHRDRVELPLYAKCLVGLEHHRMGDTSRRDELVRMVSQFLKQDAENQTAYLDLGQSNYWWCWYGSNTESNAWFLRLLTVSEPKGETARGLVKYLVNSRKHGSWWNSTRDTAFAIEAIAAWFKASGEATPDMEVEISLGEKSLRTLKINKENLFSFDGTVVLTGDQLATGQHRITLRKSGTGPLYANAYLEVFSLEDRLRAAGLEVKVSRHISKLIPLVDKTETPDASGLLVTQQSERFRREKMADNAILKSGERIEVELVIDSKNDYEYLLLSDKKAAGFEAVEALSGYLVGSGLSTYMEPRHQSVDFFLHHLPRGTHTLRYLLRAETPGTFKALPATLEAMYAPELRGNSNDMPLGVE